MEGGEVEEKDGGDWREAEGRRRDLGRRGDGKLRRGERKGVGGVLTTSPSLPSLLLLLPPSPLSPVLERDS